MSCAARPRMVQLDGLRGIAVILVMFHHWTIWGHESGVGNIGVQLFFVLSGFLITGILLDTRTKTTCRIRLLQTFCKFAADRVVRIWPIYMLVLIAVTLAGDRFERAEAMPMHFLFLSNVLFAIRGEFDSTLSHFWSVGVEQQFYLAWPFAVLLLDRVHLERLTFLLVAIAPVFRLALFVLGYTEFATFNTLPFASMDSLGMGALAAIWVRAHQDETTARMRRLSIAAGFAGAGFLLLRLTDWSAANLEQSFYAIVFAWIILRASAGFSGTVGHLLECKPLVSVGIISYGVYVYHMFMPRAVGALFRALDAPLWLQEGMLFLLICAAGTFAVAAASWISVEKPAIKLRRSLYRQRSAHAV